MRFYGFYSLLYAVEQKLNYFAKEVRLRLFSKKSGEVTFQCRQIDPNMNTDLYRMYETVILYYITHTRDLQNFNCYSLHFYLRSHLMS